MLRLTEKLLRKIIRKAINESFLFNQPSSAMKYLEMNFVKDESKSEHIGTKFGPSVGRMVFLKKNKRPITIEDLQILARLKLGKNHEIYPGDDANEIVVEYEV